jgi:probable rRNA maturation factor
MPDTPIAFITENVAFTLSDQEHLKEWLKEVIAKNGYVLEDLTYIFCSDDYLHQINLEYLNHDTYTDIITFDNADDDGTIESDIFISIDRVKENAATQQTSFTEELHRVMIHGVLHLVGFDDKTAALKKQMQLEEDKSLSLRKFAPKEL